MLMYFSLVLLHKVINDRKPEYLYSQVKFQTFRRETRNSDHLTLVTNKLRAATAGKSFLPRTIQQWNSLPFNLREISDKVAFKLSLKKHIKDYIPVK